MKKADRLNQELIYLSYRKSFNLNELTSKFKISERTALRDIAELEEMGLPLYSEVGRNGGYKISQEKLWVPIKFNFEEINAIFFALKSMDLVSTTPLKKSFSSIYQKLLKSLPINYQKQIKQMQNIVKYRREPSVDDTQNLTLLLQAATQNLAVTCQNTQAEQKQTLQIANIFYQNGLWYTEAFDLRRETYRIYKCNKLKQLKLSPDKQTKKIAELTKIRTNYFNNFRTIKFRCRLTEHGKKAALRDLYPSMKVETHHNANYLTGQYNPQELDYMVQYLLKLGSDVRIIEPESLKDAYLKQLRKIVDSYC
ncbi:MULTISPECIES: YafY family protein [Lactobacillus]|uniref:WYL domain-containing protein n=1 Tax=Lactobacillus xujianguonis TaxID=2495899 RepID=A0A437SX63_9LACO|nr:MULTISPECIES: WYL domain-containing protein [Lactobacillus]RVU71511.1 WYL domain-containing protein [Lactobacillus xujianguonis]RVU76699.1 WYL domain-containing protein [Lactobacillus xujianguonis]